MLNCYIHDGKKKELDCLINNNSLKIKPIVIEVLNYSYYHSAIDHKEHDCNERFIGKQKLIDKINLGKDELTEKDVLKYITNEVQKVYSNWYFDLTKMKRFLNFFTLAFTLLVFLTGLNNVLDKDYTNKQLVNKYNIAKYFSSQSLLLLNKEDVNDQKTRYLYKKK